LIREAEARDLRQWDEFHWEQNAWDASGDARRGATAYGLRPLRAKPDADAEKLAGREPDVLARVVRPPRVRATVRLVRPAAAAELCKQGAVQSAARSCAARAWTVLPEQQVQPDVVVPPEPQKH
jgi:hypothetical protein